jgi:hypothetical protein
MGVYLYLHRDDPGRIADFEEGRRDSWDYFRFDIPDDRQIVASTPERMNVSKHTTLDLGLYWDVLLFMLCEPYRNQVSPQAPGIENLHLEDPLYWAIAGAHVAEYDTRQDRSLRYSTVVQVQQIADALSPVTFDTLRPFADGDAMRRAGIYRSRSYANSPQTEETFARILISLQLHYRNAIEHGQMMIHEWV